MHGAWGSFWIGYGVLWLLIGTGAIPPLTSAGEVAYGYWFAGLAAVTLSGALAAMRENLGLAAVLHTLWIGAGCLAVGLMTGTAFWEVIGAYVLMLSALLAWYAATSLIFKGSGPRSCRLVRPGWPTRSRTSTSVWVNPASNTDRSSWQTKASSLKGPLLEKAGPLVP